MAASNIGGIIQVIGVNWITAVAEACPYLGLSNSQQH